MRNIGAECCAWSRGYLAGYHRGLRRAARPHRPKPLARILVLTGAFVAVVGTSIGIVAAWAGAELFLNTLNDEKPIVKKVIGKHEAWNRVSEAIRRAGAQVVVRTNTH